MPRKKDPKSKRGRVEFLAEPEWINRVTAHAEKLGLNLSSFIRLSVNKQMERDGADEEKSPKPRRAD